MGKTVILTGGTGFLGSNILELMLENNFRVFLLKRSFDNLEKINPFLNNQNLILVDIDKEKIENVFKNGIDFIIHTATCYGRSGEEMSDIVEANFNFPVKLLEEGIKNKISGFINTDTFFNEKMKFTGKEGCYVKTKKDFVRKAKEAIEGTSVKFINLMVEQMYGPNDNPTKFTPFIVKELLSNKTEIPLTKGEQKRDFIFVKDVAQAFLQVIKNFDKLNSFEEFGLGWGKTCSLSFFVEKIKEKTHSSSVLKWGELPYRENEIMLSCANIENNKKIEWTPKYSLDEGIEEIIR